MMRGQKAFAVAMRAPDGSIAVHTEPLASIYRSKITKVPFLRGVILLWDALGLGMRALTLSANTQTGEDEKLEGPALYLTLAFSLAMGIGLFFLIPTSIGGGVQHLVTQNGMDNLYWLGNLVEGVVQLLLLVGYIWAIGFMPDIKRVFQYHGAEHKTINAFEAGAELTPENVEKFPIEHPRCGTAFLLTLVLFSIILFSLLGPLPFYLRIISRIAFIPVLAGIAIEYIRWTANNLNNPLVKLLIKPNLALQLLTTRPPDREMLEVAIESFQAMRKAENEAS
jgi:uncharacterized protein YqhQ